MHTSHAMIRGIKKLSECCSLDLLALRKWVTKYIATKGPKMAILARSADKPQKSWHVPFIQSMQSRIYIPQKRLVAQGV